MESHCKSPAWKKNANFLWSLHRITCWNITKFCDRNSYLSFYCYSWIINISALKFCSLLCFPGYISLFRRWCFLKNGVIGNYVLVSLYFCYIFSLISVECLTLKFGKCFFMELSYHLGLILWKSFFRLETFMNSCHCGSTIASRYHQCLLQSNSEIFYWTELKACWENSQKYQKSGIYKKKRMVSEKSLEMSKKKASYFE